MAAERRGASSSPTIAADAADKAKAILGMDIKGETVEKVLIAPAADILKEYYVGLIMDRGSKKIILMVTKEGGVEIEELAVTDPEKIIKFPIDIASGIDENALRSVLTGVFEKPALIEQATDTVKKDVYAVCRERCVAGGNQPVRVG